MIAILLLGCSWLSTAVPKEKQLGVSESYTLYQKYETAVIVLPRETSNEEDVAELQSLVKQIHAHGKDALIIVCIDQPDEWDVGIMCPRHIYAKHGKLD